jgi:FtsZ-binding cell division protein ZapB
MPTNLEIIENLTGNCEQLHIYIKRLKKERDTALKHAVEMEKQREDLRGENLSLKEQLTKIKFGRSS